MMTLAAGTRLGRYEICSKIGAGGMGEVYLAQDGKLDRRVALKILPAEVVEDKKRMQRFSQEAKAVSALNHPNILTIHEIGEAGSSQTAAEGLVHFIATEFVDGITLRDRMTRGDAIRLSAALDIAAQVASALAAAHAAGIIHRDIKPDNLMLRKDGFVKVLFGLAKLTAPTGSDTDSEAATRMRFSTEPGMIVGTVAYMSPEQAGGLNVDARTDIWSLGVVLYEMIAARAPFEGKDVHRQIIAIQEQHASQLSRHTDGVPERLEEIVAKTLAKDPDERYQTAKDLMIDLRNLKRKLEVDAEIQRSVSPELKTRSDTVQPTLEEDAVATTQQAQLPGATLEETRSTSSAEYIISEIRRHKRSLTVALAVLLLAAVGFGYWFSARRASNATQIESIAVLPFVNASGNSEVEYLSDGLTESLITSLSQLPKLSVKARSSVFRYKGKDAPPQQVGKELNVQAILNGRVVQRGNDLTLHIELVDVKTETALWSGDYNRSMTNLVSLPGEIARDVSSKLRLRLSGADEQKLAKNYTSNAEAYQSYLKGRYHLAKYTPPEIQTGISYFQQAIDIDPSYALAYAGLADAYRTSGLVGEMPATDFFPKAKAAAQKAIEIDDTLAEAHAELGFTIFWYDWDWNASEDQLKRALELDPNSADAHLFYAHLLSNTGRHAEGLAEVKRASELDPLDLRINGLEEQFLVHAGKPDEALTFLHKTLELNPNNWFAHMFASSAYIEKGMLAEAVVEARKARELNSANSQPIAQLGYALAKSGKQAEARGLLEELLKLSTQRYVSPGNIALIYNGLGQADETLAWLERGYERRDPKMVFLKVEPKWNNLRADPRFQDLLRRVGFPQ
ncbi:MAG TPA: protein kinase [Pyrinomonadaceae bacterium]|nr:protein kinase [Pyrinomonadaceae bacterium]